MCVASGLVSWCFEPSQPQRITSGLNTNFTLSYSVNNEQVILPQVMFVFVFFFFCRHSTRESASSKVTYFILRAYTGTGVSHSQHRKNYSSASFRWLKQSWDSEHSDCKPMTPQAITTIQLANRSAQMVPPEVLDLWRWTQKTLQLCLM